MTETALVVVRTFINQFEAEIAKSALDAAGIESMIRSDDCGGTRPHLWMSGVELIVRQDDVAEAVTVLDTPSAPG
ncbi:MAG TPA: DUF2007 domain-containing protein [Vicinamibacterales bacterium]|nr:DUF2007 domain-containing protein [Vicinamibacterales bacterium]